MIPLQGIDEEEGP